MKLADSGGKLYSSVAADQLCMDVVVPRLESVGVDKKAIRRWMCEASSEASEPGEGGGLRRSKRRSDGDERAHGRHGATWRSCSRRVVSLGACRGRRGTCDEREARAASKKQVLVKRPRQMKSLESLVSRRLCAAAEPTYDACSLR